MNTVSVVGPRAQPVEQKKEKKSDMETILEGLQIANGILGIGSNIQSIRSSQRNIDEKDFVAGGGVTKDQEIEARNKFAQGAEGDPDSFLLGHVRGADGADSPLRLKAKAEKPELITIKTPGANGPVTKVVAKTAGAEYPAVADAPPERTRAVTVRNADGSETTQIVPDKAGSSFVSAAKPDKAPDYGKTYTEMVNHLENPRGNAAVQQAGRNLLAAGTAKSLIEQYPDLDKMPVDQVNLLNGEIAKIAQGGVPSQHTQEGLSTKTFQSRWSGFMQSVDNKPNGAQLGAFIRQNKNYLDDVTKVNEKLVTDYKHRIYSGYKSRLTPEQDEQFKLEYPDLFQGRAPAGAVAGAKPEPGTAIAAPAGQPPAPAAELHPQAPAAKDWATKNKDSPDPATRAKALEILKRLSTPPAVDASSNGAQNSLGNRYRGNRG